MSGAGRHLRDRRLAACLRAMLEPHGRGLVDQPRVASILRVSLKAATYARKPHMHLWL